MSNSHITEGQAEHMIDLPEKKKPEKKPERGYTLAEILTVALIIALLSTFAFSSYRKARQRAIETQGIHQMKELAAAMEAHYNDNGIYALSFEGLQPTYINEGYVLSDSPNKSRSIAFVQGFTCFWTVNPINPQRYSIRAKGIYRHRYDISDWLELRITDRGTVEGRRYSNGVSQWRPI
ncbi:MAG TPA: prepilin-type N-terminal cleavage/methylation domain-containing protein [bacterium]|jgi:prepilin-type N-terminal cleavage/methylation domain-containing protein